MVALARVGVLGVRLPFSFVCVYALGRVFLSLARVRMCLRVCASVLVWCLVPCGVCACVCARLFFFPLVFLIAFFCLCGRCLLRLSLLFFRCLSSFCGFALLFLIACPILVSLVFFAGACRGLRFSPRHRSAPLRLFARLRCPFLAPARGRRYAASRMCLRKRRLLSPACVFFAYVGCCCARLVFRGWSPACARASVSYRLSVFDPSCLIAFSVCILFRF